VAFYAYSSVVGPLAVAQRQQFPQASLALLKNCRNHCLILGAGIAVALAPLAFTSRYWLAACPDSVSPLQWYFWTVPLSYGAHGFVMLANGVFNGVGRPYHGLCLSLLRCLVFLWPAATFMNHLWPGHGVYMAITLSNGLSATAAVFLLKRMYASGPDSIPPTPHQPLSRKLL
jgi:Na+-driven multidrug efflux pump